MAAEQPLISIGEAIFSLALGGACYKLGLENQERFQNLADTSSVPAEFFQALVTVINGITQPVNTTKADFLSLRSQRAAAILFEIEFKKPMVSGYATQYGAVMALIKKLQDIDHQIAGACPGFLTTESEFMSVVQKVRDLTIESCGQLALYERWAQPRDNSPIEHVRHVVNLKIQNGANLSELEDARTHVESYFSDPAKRIRMIHLGTGRGI